jgi:DNA-binding NtrC family response regulator
MEARAGVPAFPVKVLAVTRVTEYFLVYPLGLVCLGLVLGCRTAQLYPKEGASLNNSGIRVLVVDDEPVIAATLATMLRLNGFTAESFTRPLDALADAMAQPPDVLLTDIVMPGMSGIDLAVQIKLQCPGCKVLLFSGQAATVSFVQDAEKLGEDIHILPKPLHPSELLTAIRDQCSQN